MGGHFSRDNWEIMKDYPEPFEGWKKGASVTINTDITKMISDENATLLM